MAIYVVYDCSLESAGHVKKPRPNYGLHAHYCPAIHREYHDIDYADKLSESEKEWMSRFMEEYTHSRFMNDGADHNLCVDDCAPEDGKTRHAAGCPRAARMRESNYRRRDLHGVMRAKNNLIPLHTPAGEETALRGHYGAGMNLDEDAIIAIIDQEKKERD